MIVRAKFKVAAKTPTNTEGGDEITLEAVTGGSVENDSFFKWTPSGSIKLGLVVPSTSAAFEVGKEYYVDFTPADPPAAE